jgi:PKD repeat protein
MYDKAGTYPITLTVLDDSGLACNAGQARKNIQLIAAPVAKAGKDIETCSNAPTAFDGSASTGGERPIISYKWTFGDGSSDGLAKTNHIYKEPGLYTATLTVKTPELSRCDNRAEDRRKVRVLAAPLAEFKAGDGCVGERLTFDAAEAAAANGASARYSWDFGDNGRGNGVVARHSYDRAGHYTVRLKADKPENSVCSSSESSRKIKINQPPVPRIRWKVAGKSMNFETQQTVLPNTVLHFSAAESMDKDGSISKVLWDFGDGQQAEGWFVEHSYTKPGQYAVRLTVADDNADLACGTAQTELPVFVVGPPNLQIQGPKQVCVNKEVRYRLLGKAEQVRWVFGNGLQRQGREVKARFSHVGKRAIHTVVDSQPGPVLTVQALDLPELALPEYLTALAGETVRIRPLLVRETGLQPLLSWSAGDGTTRTGKTFQHVYSKPGEYTVRLRSSGGPEQPACLVRENAIAVTVLPAPEARIFHEPERIFSGGARDEVLFYTELFNSQGNWTCRWDFGDGSTTEGAVVSHLFRQPGTYNVTLTLLDGSGIARKTYQFSKKIVVQAHEQD